jgi:site-specific DNA recombinase
MVNILGSFAEFERELIADRTRRGRRHKVEVRQQYLGGNSSYGYRYVPRDKAAGKEGHLEIVAEEAVVVKRMFDWVDKEGLSARRVTDRLSKMQVPPRKGGTRWGKSSVLRILRNEMYAGVWYYNKYEGCEPATPSKSHKYRKSLKCSLRRRPRSEWLPVILPKELILIDQGQWERVQQQVNRNITFSPRNSKHQYFLKGLVQCGGCGARYVGDPCHGKYYYRCLSRCKKQPTIREEILDGVVWDAIKEIILNPNLIAGQLDKLQKRRAEEAEKVKVETKETNHILKDIEMEEARIIEAYRKSIITPAQLGRELEQINIRKASLEMRSESLAGKSASPPPSVIRRSVSEFCREVAGKLESFSFEERQQFLRLLVEDIVYEGKRVRIKGIVPIGIKAKDNALESETVRKETGPVFVGRIATTTAHYLVHNSGRTEDMTLYRRDPNSVEFPFEISRSFPDKTLALYEQFDSAFLYRLVQQKPSATLKELCDLVLKDRGVIISEQSMCKLLLRVGLSRAARRRLQARPVIRERPKAA